MKATTNFIELYNLCGDGEATETTVSIFNSVRKVKTDRKGTYIIKAVSPYKNGVLTEKVYLTNENA